MASYRVLSKSYFGDLKDDVYHKISFHALKIL